MFTESGLGTFKMAPGRWCSVLAVLLALGIAVVLPDAQLVSRTACGYLAKLACTQRFVVGRHDALEQELPSLLTSIFRLTYSSKGTQCSLFGAWEQRAVYSPGVGCALIYPDSDGQYPVGTLSQLRASIR